MLARPLTDAYGRPLAGLVRALAPAPEPRAGAGGVPLVGVDFRYCRSAGCAAWTGDERLTASNRRTTAFTSVEDRRRTGGGVEVTYWIYRPSLGWERVVRRAGSADVAAAAKTPLLESASPKLVPLETLAGATITTSRAPRSRRGGGRSSPSIQGDRAKARSPHGVVVLHHAEAVSELIPPGSEPVKVPIGWR